VPAAVVAGEPPGPVPLEHQQPAVERARHDGRQQAGTGDQVDSSLPECVDRRCVRRRALAADDDDLVAFCVVEQSR